jgi:endonuclease/exonuclease/phosphatase family metal-dependent hydrolase
MSSASLSVLTWNVNFRAASTLAALTTLPDLPDVVTLQEVKREHASAIRERLQGMGYESVYSLPADAGEPAYGNVVAARTKLTPLDSTTFGLPYAQLVAHVRVETPDGPINVITIHVPNGSGYGWQKIDTLDALRRTVLALKGAPLVLSGDFNEPQWTPLQDGHVVTWARDWDDERWTLWKKRTFDGVKGSGKRWDAAVRWFFDENDSGLRNAFWECAGRGSMEQTHVQGGQPRWFDHVFVSEHFRVKECTYLRSFRTDGYSDHSALIAALSCAPRPTSSRREKGTT